ncbi:MAG TPA: hypothetical protein PJ994_05125 [Tepidiformaceae bacterium]|nr:hypothetical protein [Tepidiformaceae bacterium]HMO97022.1 hypothetical protein [Tepidiformaceae bacterium]
MSRQRAWRGVALGAAAFAGLAGLFAVSGQSASGSYELWWRTLTGGRATTGAQYEVRAAIGQPLTGRSTGGEYVVESGFFGGGAQEKYFRYLPLLSSDGVP